MSFTRTEQFLDGIASGASVPAPFTREEQYLEKIIEKVKELEEEISGGGGGAEDFVIEFTITPGAEMTVTSETTFAQVYSAYQQGKNIKGTSSVTGLGDLLFYMTQINDSSVKLFTYLDTDLLATINGDSEGWSMTVHQ